MRDVKVQWPDGDVIVVAKLKDTVVIDRADLEKLYWDYTAVTLDTNTPPDMQKTLQRIEELLK